MVYRTIREIASDIRQNWNPVNYAAKPYLDAMFYLDKITDKYYSDSGDMIIRYFLGNATTWKGEHARRIKAELNAMLNKK